MPMEAGKRFESSPVVSTAKLDGPVRKILEEAAEMDAAKPRWRVSEAPLREKGPPAWIPTWELDIPGGPLKEDARFRAICPYRSLAGIPGTLECDFVLLVAGTPALPPPPPITAIGLSAPPKSAEPAARLKSLIWLTFEDSLGWSDMASELAVLATLAILSNGLRQMLPEVAGGPGFWKMRTGRWGQMALLPRELVAAHLLGCGALFSHSLDLVEAVCHPWWDESAPLPEGISVAMLDEARHLLEVWDDSSRSAERQEWKRTERSRAGVPGYPSLVPDSMFPDLGLPRREGRRRPSRPNVGRGLGRSAPLQPGKSPAIWTPPRPAWPGLFRRTACAACGAPVEVRAPDPGTPALADCPVCDTRMYFEGGSLLRLEKNEPRKTHFSWGSGQSVELTCPQCGAAHTLPAPMSHRTSDEAVASLWEWPADRLKYRCANCQTWIQADPADASESARDR